MSGQNTNVIGVRLSDVMDAQTDVVAGMKSFLSVWEKQGRLHTEAKMKIGRLHPEFARSMRRRRRCDQAFQEEGTVKKMSRMLFEYQVPFWYFRHVLLPFILNPQDEVGILFSFFAQEQAEAQRGNVTAHSLASDSKQSPWLIGISLKMQHPYSPNSTTASGRARTSLGPG